jgi:hypothetical protein
MGRVFFPTYSLNRWGARETDQQATLGAAIERFPAEPNPRAAQNPTPPILGALPTYVRYANGGTTYWGARPPVLPVPVRIPPAAPPSGPAYPVTPLPIISSSGGGGQVQPPPVSAQPGPTPTVSVPPPAPTGAVLISSGGGTQTPSTSTIVAAAPSSDFVSGIATWLGGTTPIFNYNVPNGLLAGAVVLGFAFLSSGKKR